MFTKPELGSEAIELSEDELKTIRFFFDFTNKIFVFGEWSTNANVNGVSSRNPTRFHDTVDEAEFYTALAGATRMPKFPPFALRACCTMLLCIGSRLRGRAAVANDYLRDARRLVGLSTVCEPASQLLVSALLLLASSTSDCLALDGEASRHATIAHGLAGLVPGMRTEIRVGVNVVRYLHTSAAHGAGWPPARAAAGVSLAC